jgi:hypothetical protein
MADETKPLEPIVKIFMDGSGKMSWDVPKEGTVSRRQVYELLGMTRYAEHVLMDMLKQPSMKT